MMYLKARQPPSAVAPTAMYLPCLRNLEDAVHASWRTLRVPVDDVTFWAILRRGATVHPLHKASYTEAVSVAAHPQHNHIVFPMVPAAADALAAAHPDFAADGLMGEWRLERVTSDAAPRPLALRLAQALALPAFMEAVARAPPHGNPPWLAAAFDSVRGRPLRELAEEAAAQAAAEAAAAAAVAATQDDIVMSSY